MKAIILVAAVSVAAYALVSTAFAKAPEGWETDVDAAITLAKKEQKAVMIEFTGSDWCPPCIMMEKEVFSKEEFVKKASEDFILVYVDFPRGDKELAEKNKPIGERFEITGYPTVILLDSEGEEFDRFSASSFPEVDKFLNKLSLSLEYKDLD
jgi:thiol-disulfide isomerase/thioredoxin